MAGGRGRRRGWHSSCSYSAASLRRGGWCPLLDSTAHRRLERPVLSSKAPGTAPSKTAGSPPLAASHSQSAPVTRGTKDEKDHHCEVMDSRTALSSRLSFSCCCSPIDQPFPSVRWLRPVHSRS